MNKFGDLRREFIKGVATYVVSMAFSPTFSMYNLKKKNQSEIPLKSISTEKSMPPLFDCNKYIGPGFPDRADFPKASDLLVHMDRLCIDRAISWHTNARVTNPMEGNKQLINEIETNCATNRIIPSFIITPEISNDSGLMEEFQRLVKKHNIRAFHFFLDTPLTNESFEWTLHDIAPVIRTILPFEPVLFIEIRGSNLDQIKKFSGEFPQVSIVCSNCSQSGFPTLFEIMESRSNIYLDTSFLYLYHSIEYIINRFGVERLIFGAGYKSNNGASIATLAHADVSLEQAQLIAHSNLEQLVDIEEPLSGLTPIKGDRLWHRLLRREPLGPKIVDAHSHLFYTSNSDRYYWCSECINIDIFANHAINSMKALGVENMVIAGFENPFWPSLKANNYLEEHTKKYDNYFNGYLVFNPDSENADILISKLDDFFSRSFFIGFKFLNDYWKIPVTDPRFNPIWEYANTHRLPVLIHTWNGKYDAPAMLTDIVSRYPEAIFILGHSGNFDRMDAEKLAIENSNVYLEWCGSFYNPSDWSESLERIGNRKLLYGSDGMYHYPAYEMGRLLSLDVPDATLIPILGENMSHIMALRRESYIKN